jgi:N-acetylmuramic acid 6-phosphate etherase
MKTEEQPPKSKWIDKMSNKKALKVMLDNQSEAIKAIEFVLKDIDKVVSSIFKRLYTYSNSRIIYVGAGTSARIGVQDGTELLPTFGWPQERVAYLVAGGLRALTEPVENAEDDVLEAKKMIDEMKITSSDVILALAASGETPFTILVVNEANNKNALTIGISNNPDAQLQKLAMLGVTLDTGFEILAGSTRLKAGTAQKICLNLISTLVMSNLGNVEDGMMINMLPKNKKLRKRKKIINKLLSFNKL